MKWVVGGVCVSILIFGASMCQTGYAQTAQQTLMKTCNTQASVQKLTGDARKSFMSDCLSGKTPSASTGSAPISPQERMKSCNTQAGAQKLTGDLRKQFMSACLKG